MKPDITYEQALEKASPRLKKQIQASVELLHKSESLMLKYDPENGAWCGFSGGKDSQALYHIVQLSGVKFKAYFSPTSVDPPQVIRFIRKNYPEVEFTRLQESIYTAFKRLKVLPSMRVRWCCALFKEKGGENKVTLTGVRKAESVKRSKRKEVEVTNHKFSGNLEEFEEYSERRIKRIAKNLNQDQFAEVKESEIRCINGKDKIIINPIIDWTDKDVWEFLNDVMEVPHCELYDPPYNQTRIGCIGCPMATAKNQRKQLDMWPYVKEKWIRAIMEVRKETYDEQLATPPTTSSTTRIWDKHQANAIAQNILNDKDLGQTSGERYRSKHPQRYELGADVKQALSLKDWQLGQKDLLKIMPKGLAETKNDLKPYKNIMAKSENTANFQIAPARNARPLARYTMSKRKERSRNTFLIGG